MSANDCQERIVDFHKYIVSLRKDKDYTVLNRECEPEALNFDMPRNTTVNLKGARSVLMQTTGAEKQWCTVMLAVTADGCKLPPYVIFERKTMLKDRVPNGILVRIQDKGWMSAS